MSVGKAADTTWPALGPWWASVVLHTTQRPARLVNMVKGISR